MVMMAMTKKMSTTAAGEEGVGVGGPAARARSIFALVLLLLLLLLRRLGPLIATLVPAALLGRFLLGLGRLVLLRRLGRLLLPTVIAVIRLRLLLALFLRRLLLLHIAVTIAVAVVHFDVEVAEPR